MIILVILLLICIAINFFSMIQYRITVGHNLIYSQLFEISHNIHSFKINFTKNYY